MYIEKVCNHCENKFIARNCRQAKKKFCTTACSIASKAVIKEFTTCQNCGNSLNSGQPKFCSRSCSAIYSNANRPVESRIKQRETLLAHNAANPKPKKVKEVKTRIKKIKDSTTNQPIENLYPRKYSSVIKFTALYLNKEKDVITYSDVDLFKEYINQELHVNNLSPSQIKDKLGIKYSNFSSFIKDCLKIPLKSVKDSVRTIIYNSIDIEPMLKKFIIINVNLT